jgi:hypothetical protein
MQRWEILNYLLERFPDNGSYLEIGSQSKACIKNIKAGFKEDIEPAPKGARGPTYQLMSDDFFEKVAPTLLRKWDVIFIDGLHLCNQAIRDVWNSAKYLTDNGFIVLHDCCPPTEQSQLRIQKGDIWMGDVWKAHAWLIQRFTHIWTIAEDCGLGIIKGPIKFDLPPNEELLKFEWSDFNEEKICLRSWEDSIPLIS